jgi:geranylgeranyl diphosphate synthase type II
MSSELHDEVIVFRTQVNERLEELLPPEGSAPRQLHEALRYSLVAPGKRIRPLMTILTATRLGADAEASLDPACALEIVHTASLIMDDMPFMDDATTRRGKPAHHRVFGEDLAALASLELLSRAYGVMARARGLDDRLRLELIRLLCDTVGSEGIIAGQLSDLRSETFTPDAEALTSMYTQKTGTLFVAASEMGARIARVPLAWIEPIREFAAHMGLVFQIVDDLLDRFGTLEATGKDVRQDDGKTTLVSVLGPDEAKAEVCRRLEAAERALAPLGPAGKPLDLMVRALMGPGIATVMRD